MLQTVDLLITFLDMRKAYVPIPLVFTAGYGGPSFDMETSVRVASPILVFLLNTKKVHFHLYSEKI